MLEGTTEVKFTDTLKQDFSRKYVQGRLQVRAGKVARTLLSRIGLAMSVPVLPFSDAKHCNRSRKRLQPPLQTFASAIANVCAEKTLFVESLPPCVSTEP